MGRFVHWLIMGFLSCWLCACLWGLLSTLFGTNPTIMMSSFCGFSYFLGDLSSI